MENIVYVVTNIADETVLVVTTEREAAYRTAAIAQKLGADPSDVAITPMKLDIQYGRGTEMCYDDADINETLDMMEDWEEDEDEDGCDCNCDCDCYDDEEDDYDDDEDEEDADEGDDEFDCPALNLLGILLSSLCNK